MSKSVLNIHLIVTTTAAVVALLSAAFLSAAVILGLPDKTETPDDYLQDVCRKVRKTLDPHLPCPEEIAEGAGRPTDRKSLWSIIRTLCVPVSYLGLSFPCVKVDRAEGYAVIRSPSPSRVDFIVTPTSNIDGIESLAHSSVEAPNLFRAGWLSRNLLRETTNHNISWDDVILAINSKATRSQDHLHIHLGCVDLKLRSFLATETMRNGSAWRVVKPEAMTSGLFVKFLPQEAINKDLFRMIYDEIPGGAQFAERETIALAGVGKGSKRGFALMVTLDPVPAEEFLAPGC